HGYYESLSKVGDALPSTFSLDDNYPNPFNPSTNIGFSLPQKQEVTLRVFNLLGQEVKTLQQGEMDQGHHVLTWHGDNNSGESVASGVYFYRLETSGFAESKKMMLLK
ncbi:MAG: T9SS type A sorting domain-containing protein, partial [bacterium]|nr:T9SS type A sorting domain-containing protein [bacterium]